MSNRRLGAISRQVGRTPDAGPIEVHLKAISEDRRLPAYAIRQCVVRFEEAAPALRAVLSKAASGEAMADGEDNLFFRGLYVLAEARDREALQPLLRLLHLPREDVDHLLGDALTASLPRIVVSLFDGDTDTLFEAIANLALEDFTRASLLSAAVFLTWEKRIELDYMQAFLVRFDEEKLAPDGDYVWIAWLEAIALLNLQSLAPRVKKAWSGTRIPEDILEYHDFEEDLAAAGREPDNIARFTRANTGYIDDAVEAQAWADHDDKPVAPSSGSGDPFAKAKLLAKIAAEMPWLAEPAPFHVGRNDPCPCGSGKKYKKCCLTD